MNLEKEYVELLIEQFRVEYKKKDRSGIYALTQRLMTYNTNKIEGSTLTEEQIASLFDTGLIPFDKTAIRAKDVEEATGHFAMFNYMLETLDCSLSQELIKQFHSKLKNGVFEDILNEFPVGDYKNKKNIVDQITTASPEEVVDKMCSLLEEYNSKEKHSLEDISMFHVRYETIHPFQAGNGRTGRLIAFRECLRNEIVPFIVKDKNKYEYYSALRDFSKHGTVDSLLVFFQQEQKEYFDLGFDFVVPYQDKSIEERIQDTRASKKELQKMYGKQANDIDR